MINFRYHIVSLTAVFLALVIGILMGTTVVSKATVDGLKANVRRAEARSAAVHRTNDQLNDELSARVEVTEETDEALNDSVLAHTVRDQLVDVPVLVIVTDGIDKKRIDATLAVLAAAGAAVPGVLTVTDRLGADGTEADRLRELLDVPTGVDPHQAAARRVAGVLVDAGLTPSGSTAEAGEPTSTSVADPDATPSTTVVSPSTTVRDDDDAGSGTATSTTAPEAEPADADDGPDALDILLEEGFLKYRALDGDDESDSLRVALDAGENRYVVLTGPEPEAVDTNFVVPLVAAIVRQGPVAQVFATGPADPTDPRATDALPGALLGREGVEGHVSTVDDLGSYPGDVALVFALVEAAQGRFGTYGIGNLAGAVVPDVPPPTETGSDPER